MNAFAVAHGHHQPEKRGPVQQREASTNDADDAKTRFAAIVLPHLDDAYVFAVWLTGNPVDAEHVVEDACLHAFRAIKDFAGSSPRAWILTIVRHRARLWLRKDRPTAYAVESGTDSMDPAPSAAGHAYIETPEAPLTAEADLARLHAALAGLPMPLLETVVLREIHGLNYREIAEVTEVPIGTVMSRLAQGRRNLIATIGGTGS
jgi:RNA polymerase sigma-70 factor (ECF subfamily)